MVKTAFRKLKSRRGESLIESLVAILAFTISSIVMYSMVTTAADINLTARKADEDFQEQVVIVEQAQGAGTQSSVSLSLTKSPDSNTLKPMGNVKVAVYRSDDLVAYYAIPKGDG